VASGIESHCMNNQDSHSCVLDGCTWSDGIVVMDPGRRRILEDGIFRVSNASHVTNSSHGPCDGFIKRSWQLTRQDHSDATTRNEAIFGRNGACSLPPTLAM
jgi:hypothetical protein